MERALHLAKHGQYSAHPNPMVGCVLVKDGNVVGEGWHALAGEPHAEISALQAAGENARGATAFVTLEPCAHHGRTPPCSESLIQAGVSDVVVARKDPNPRVDGKGLQALSDAGIPVRCGLMKSEVDSLLAGFLSRIERGRPYVRLKIACSIDGRIAMANGQSQWISGDEARADVQRLRARSGAIMTGIGTVLADDPSLTVRDASLNKQGTQPIRVVVDSKLRMPASAKMLSLPGTTVIACGDEQKGRDLVDACSSPSSRLASWAACCSGAAGRRRRTQPGSGAPALPPPWRFCGWPPASQSLRRGAPRSAAVLNAGL